MRRLFALAVVVAALAAPVPARAQMAGQRGGAAVASFVGVHLFGIFEMEQMLAQKSFDAVVGSSSPKFFGAGVEATNIWKGAFARFTATRSSQDGSRVFVDASHVVHSLNVPVTIGLTPIEVGGGWRFGKPPSSRARRSVAPYIGAALLFQKYSETSPAASASENVEETDSGASVFAGLDIGVKSFHFGFEGLYRHLPNAVGVTGVSADFNEDNLGGLAFRALFGVTF